MFNNNVNLLLVTCLLLIMCAGTGAQSDDLGIDYCALLAEPDCLILEANEEAMRNVSSYAVAFALTGEINNTNMTGGSQQKAFVVSGETQLAFDAEAAAGGPAISADATQEERAALFERILTSITGALSMTITATSSEGTSEITINALMDNGVYLVDSATLESLTDEPMEGVEWLGVDITGALETLMAMPDIASSVDIISMPGIADLEGLEQVLTVTRLPDSEVNGVDVAVFDYEFDLPALLELPGLNERAMQLSEADAPLKAGMLDIVENMRVSARTSVGLADFYTYHTLINFSIELDGESMGNADGSLVSAQFNIEADMSEHGQPVSVEIPEDAFILPLSLLLEMGSQ